MLRTNTVEAGTLDLIKRFMSDDRFNALNLVGGTALALKVGHRKSIDKPWHTASKDGNI
jgi:hypothetical protein